MIALIVAMDMNRVIGNEGQIPWRLPEDLKRFKEITMGHPMIMGRKTWESIGKVLPGRPHLVVTRNTSRLASKYADVLAAATKPDAAPFSIHPSLADALAHLQFKDPVRHYGDGPIFVIGGGELYAQALPLAKKIYLTRVNTKVEKGDVFFPEIDEGDWMVTAQEHKPADEKNPYPRSYLTMERTGWPAL